MMDSQARKRICYDSSVFSNVGLTRDMICRVELRRLTKRLDRWWQRSGVMLTTAIALCGCCCSACSCLPTISIANNLARQRRMMFIHKLIVANDGSCLFNHPS